jgi:predicted enzyme related to lactoylglutathione lyase
MVNTQLNAKLVICSVPTKNSTAAQQFYNTLFGGQDFARSLNDTINSYYRPISQDGLTLSIATRQDDREPITCFFAVDNLEETVHQLVAAGGTVVVNSTALTISGPAQAISTYQEGLKGQAAQPSTSGGNFVTMLDPDGNYLGLIQLDSSVEPLFNAQPGQRELSQEQVDQLNNWKQHGESLMG